MYSLQEQLQHYTTYTTGIAWLNIPRKFISGVTICTWQPNPNMKLWTNTSHNKSITNKSQKC